ncbi:hypothetical protein BOTBODRAFT_38119 [Botryobasidium botryosum FD-172 SS1]|uniref:Uncharacterized protein n=1 Tax=Botryobasidium botryosum (strain FD-172 SS1) TaxID=930990 RepID=A0A067LY25_BOTB1|nr:hypothetical protein BOTBODRAFT_38119 [Botryobasidium botryosum FD-172 SS1]
MAAQISTQRVPLAELDVARFSLNLDSNILDNASANTNASKGAKVHGPSSASLASLKRPFEPSSGAHSLMTPSKRRVLMQEGILYPVTNQNKPASSASPRKLYVDVIEHNALQAAGALASSVVASPKGKAQVGVVSVSARSKTPTFVSAVELEYESSISSSSSTVSLASIKSTSMPLKQSSINNTSTLAPSPSPTSLRTPTKSKSKPSTSSSKSQPQSDSSILPPGKTSPYTPTAPNPLFYHLSPVLTPTKRPARVLPASAHYPGFDIFVDKGSYERATRRARERSKARGSPSGSRSSQNQDEMRTRSRTKAQSRVGSPSEKYIEKEEKENVGLRKGKDPLGSPSKPKSTSAPASASETTPGSEKTPRARARNSAKHERTVRDERKAPLSTFGCVVREAAGSPLANSIGRSVARRLDFVMDLGENARQY